MFSTVAAASGPPIHLEAGKLLPAEDKAAPSAKIAKETSTRYSLLQFEGPTDREFRNSLSEDIEFVEYIPENAWIVRLKSSKSKVLSRKKVRYLGPYTSSRRIDPILESKAEGSSGRVNLSVEFFEAAENPKEVLRRHGRITERFGPDTWVVETTYLQIRDIAEEEHVAWVSSRPPEPETFNDDARKLIDADKVQQLPYNLTGRGFTGAVWDAGWAGQHQDLNYSLSWAGTSKSIRGDSGHSVDDHGTHVAGTMLGGGKIDNSLRGVAPDSRLITYEWPDGSSELYSETDDAVTSYGANVSQNSWGYPDNSLAGEYSTLYLSEAYDNIISGESSDVSDRISVVFSAGNFRNNVARDYNTTMPPSTAKNVITVGAVDDTGDMTFYSSWGPTDDGRIKPTVVADGGDCNQIKSTTPGNNYGSKCGTSMAAPAVSGTVLLINDKFNETHGHAPSPATSKALLVQTAEDIERSGPDYKTGWGLVNATAAVDYIETSSAGDLIHTGTLDDKGDSDNFSITVPEGEPLNLTLVWSDYPGTSSASKALINDLDLVVKNSDGERKYPWTLSWQNRTNPALQSQEDHTNPVEKVSISSASTNKYTVEVNATKLPQPSQRYSLLMPSTSAPVPELDIKSPGNASYAGTTDFNLSSNEELSGAVFSVDGSGNYSMTQKNSTYFYNDTLIVSDGAHTAVFWANNTNDYTVSESVSFTVDTQAPSLEPKEPESRANLSETFNISAVWSDNTAVSSKTFELYNSTYSQSGNLNSTIDSTLLSGGDYNITYNVSDDVGNFNDTTISVTVDNSEPVLNFYSPQDGDMFSGTFDVEAAWTDSLSGVEDAIFDLRNASFNETGSLNGTVSNSLVQSGSYNLTYNLTDRAGNRKSEKAEIVFDDQRPDLKVLSPDNGSFVGSNFSVNATFSDSVSGIKDANYSVENGSVQLSGDLNDTLDTSGLSEGAYNITFRAFDTAGNRNTSRINVTLDGTPPEVNLTSPSEGDVVRGNFSVNATYSDDVGIDRYDYSIENGTSQQSGPLNATVNSSRFADGSYEVVANVSDIAGNVNETSVNIEFDNTPPQVKDSTIEEHSNLSGEVDVNFTFEEANGIEKADFRWVNSSGNVTGWRTFNYTGFNTSNFSDGGYNLSIRLNDSLGNFRSRNLSPITFDNTPPSLDLKEYNLTAESSGWVRDNKTVQVGCSDSVTGPKQVSVEANSSTQVPVNFTLDESGASSYGFSCVDFAGNQDTETKNFSIDTETPELQSLSPSAGSTTGRSVDIQVEFFNESQESGINLSESSVSATKGNLDVEWSNSSFNASITDLEYSDSYTLEADLADNVGHNESFSTDYEVKEEPEDDGGGGGGGGSFSATDDEEEDEEETGDETGETSENDTSVEGNGTVEDSGNDTEESSGDSSSCSIYAVQEDQCRTFEDCSVPEGWREVESCSSWREQRARELIDQLSEEEGREVEEARTEFEAGNYSGAIQKALQAKDSQESRSVVREKAWILFVAAIAAILSGLLGYRWYRKRRLVSEMKKSTDKLLQRLRQRELTSEEERKLAEATEDIQDENYSEAEEKLKDLNSQ